MVAGALLCDRSFFDPVSGLNRSVKTDGVQAGHGLMYACMFMFTAPEIVRADTMSQLQEACS